MTNQQTPRVEVVLDMDQLEDELQVMLRREASYAASDYLNSGIQGLLDCDWRHKIVEWMYQVVDYHDLERETVATGVALLDRFLSVAPNCDKRQFQLSATTCLYLAIKLLRRSTFIPLSQFAHLSRNQFSLEDMQRSEKEVLDKLNWHVHPPTPQRFVPYLTSNVFVPKRAATLAALDIIYYLVELSVCDYFFTTKHASDIAMAAIWYGLDFSSKISNSEDHESVSMNAANWDHFRLMIDQIPGDHNLSLDSLQVWEGYKRMSTYDLSHYSVVNDDVDMELSDDAYSTDAATRVETSSPTFIGALSETDSSGTKLASYTNNINNDQDTTTTAGFTYLFHSFHQ